MKLWSNINFTQILWCHGFFSQKPTVGEKAIHVAWLKRWPCHEPHLKALQALLGNWWLEVGFDEIYLLKWSLFWVALREWWNETIGHIPRFIPSFPTSQPVFWEHVDFFARGDWFLLVRSIGIHKTCYLVVHGWKWVIQVFQAVVEKWFTTVFGGRFPLWMRFIEGGWNQNLHLISAIWGL